jgi:uncharacterized iron-regulated membrane protein
MTERSWAAWERPTPKQVADWLARCTPDERVQFVTRTQDDADAARVCFEQNHEARLQHNHLAARCRTLSDAESQLLDGLRLYVDERTS